MTTPTGTISLNDVNVELGLSGTTTISMNQANVRTLAGVGGSGTIISMNDLRGKSNRVSISYTFSATTADASLNLSALGGYISGKSDITITINGGVYLYATSTANYGLNLSGGTLGDTLSIVNNGVILGMGGSPTNYASVSTVSTAPIPQTSNPGGSALNLNIGINPTINNTNASAYIAGGGGSGGGAWSWTPGYNIRELSSAGGGGAGGGVGGSAITYTGTTGVGTVRATGGAGGGLGASGANGTTTGSSGTYGFQSGGGGGRVLPGTNTTRSYNSSSSTGSYDGGLGGSGGGVGGFKGNSVPATGGGTTNYIATQTGGGGTNAGVTSYTSGTVVQGGNGGGWGASGSAGQLNTSVSNTGAAGGKAVNLNGRSVTWVSGNITRVYGAIS